MTTQSVNCNFPQRFKTSRLHVEMAPKKAKKGKRQAVVCTTGACVPAQPKRAARKTNAPPSANLSSPHTLLCPLGAATDGIRCIPLGCQDYGYTTVQQNPGLFTRSAGDAWDVNAIPRTLHITMEGASTSNCTWVQFGWSPPTPNVPTAFDASSMLYTPRAIGGWTADALTIAASRDWPKICKKTSTMALCGQSRISFGFDNSVLRLPLRECRHLLFVRWCQLGGKDSFLCSLSFQIDFEGLGICRI